jgi:DNA-binding MarR family transcriptional regulator
MRKYEPTIEADSDGRLFDRRLRDHVQATLPAGSRHAQEALAAMRAASHGFRNSMDRWLEKHGLSEGRMGILWMLNRSGPSTLGDLASALDVSPRNVTGLVDHLERDGLVIRTPDPEDRRAIRAEVSPLGTAKLASIQKEMGRARDTIVAGFTDDELSDLRHLCLKLVLNMNARKELEKV